MTILALALVVPTALPARASSDVENQFVSLINQERSARGLRTLGVSGDLIDYGRRHSQVMASQNNLHHSSDLRTLTNWDLLGENVGRGGSVKALHDAFMNSPAHRDNVLRDVFGQVGVGVVVVDSTIWVTVVFRDPTVESTSAAAPPPPTGSGVVGIASTSTGKGYWVAHSDGSVTRHGDAPDLGTARGQSPAPIVAMAATPKNKGYWLVDANGGVFTFGDAPYRGSIPERRAAGAPIGQARAVSIVSTASGQGYWVVDEVGGIHTFGDAAFLGSVPGLRAAGVPIGPSSVIGMAPTSSGGGYWVLDSFGGVFTFGDAAYLGSLPALQQEGRAPAGVTGVSVAPTPSGGGYFLLGTTGQVFGFGTASA